MIRLALEADVPQIAEVERSAATLFAGTHMAWAVDAPGAPAHSYLATLERGAIWVYEARRRIAGFIAVWPETDRLFVAELSVDRSYQRRGFGRALLSTAIEYAEAHAFPSVILTTDRDLPWNRPFYETCGFAVVLEVGYDNWMRTRFQWEASNGHDLRYRCIMERNLRAR